MGRPRMILVVDDDPNLIMFFKDFFKEEGYSALCTDDPEKAVRTANLVHPDLLVIDLLMPKIDGFGVLAEVRKQTPEIKTIVISAHLAKLQDKIKEANVQAVLKKPVPFDELEKWILKLLQVTKEEIREKLPSGERPSRVSILFVDDEKEILDSVAEAVNEYGFSMDTVESGEKGLEKVKSKQYDILITDISMGKMAGYDMLNEIRVRSNYKPYVTAVVSGNLTRELKEKYQRLGVAHFMEKPLRFQEMIEWLESMLPEIVRKRQKAA